MEKIAGAAILVVGVLIVLSGSAALPKNASPEDAKFRLPGWADAAIQWGFFPCGSVCS
jgi:hypothetical protein